MTAESADPAGRSGVARPVVAARTVDFAAFVREHTDALLRTAYLLTGERSAAEDLVQETFVHLYPKWARVAGADVPLAYVRRTLANTYINQRRRPSNRDIVVDVLPERADPRDLPARLDDRDHVWGLLRTLPERQRAALVLRYFEDLTDDDIAEALQCRAGTVRSLISRGLSDLRAQAPLQASDRPARGTA